MLKRRYGAKALSVDRLKGSDSALYHALKDDFTVVPRLILFEQRSDEEALENGEDKMEPIEISSLINVREVKYSSDEETKEEVDKEVDKEVGKEVKEKKDAKGKEEHKVLKKVLTACLIRGNSSVTLSQLIRTDYVEYTGNESQAAEYAYLHAALFVYPKGHKVNQ